MSKAELTKQFIIEKVAPVFNAQGYAGTSLSDLEKATGLTKGSIYGNFENKDDIAVEAFRFNVSKIGAHLKERIEAEQTILEKLLVFPRTYRNYFRIPTLYAGCPILNTSTEADDTHPRLRQEAREAVGSWKRSVEGLLKAGIKRKEIRKDIDVSAFATLLITLIEGAVMLSKLSGNHSALNIAMDHLEENIRNLQV